MAFDAFLRIEGVPGESTDSKFADWIEILSYSHGVRQPTSSTASSVGGGTTGRCQHSDFTIAKQLDKASPVLAQKCSQGSHLPEVVLTLCRAGGEKLPFMEYKMTNVVVSRVGTHGSSEGADIPLEDVCFNYGKIEWTYTQQKRKDGGGGGSTAGSWNLETNKVS
ncbi:MAG: type VI secretion system tube protein Hcp [Planctomycetota bacterium]